MNSAISKNAVKISEKLDKNISRAISQDEVYKFLYYNDVNLATK